MEATVTMTSLYAPGPVLLQTITGRRAEAAMHGPGWVIHSGAASPLDAFAAVAGAAAAAAAGGRLPVLMSEFPAPMGNGGRLICLRRWEPQPATEANACRCSQCIGATHAAG